MIGTKLAHYEITSHLGTGGMGEVYQATDSKLGRSVAIKLLPEAFTHDADRAARFEREARVLASLNHPELAASPKVRSQSSATRLESRDGFQHDLCMDFILPESLGARFSPESAALHLAIGLYVAEETTLGQSAEVAQLSQSDFLRALGNRRIPI